MTQTYDNRLESFQKEITTEIQRLKTFSTRGLWALMLFILVSMVSWNDFPLLPVPEKVVAKLGPAPPTHFISLALLIYTFSAIILSLSRMMGGIEHKSSFNHVGYLTAFFLFYHFAGALNDNYWAVLGAGLTILCVESYRIWNYCKEATLQKQEQLDYIKRTGRMPIDD